MLALQMKVSKLYLSELLCSGPILDLVTYIL